MAQTTRREQGLTRAIVTVAAVALCCLLAVRVDRELRAYRAERLRAIRSRIDAAGSEQ